MEHSISLCKQPFLIYGVCGEAGYEFRMTRLVAGITNSEMVKHRNINVNTGYKFGKITIIKVKI